MWVTPITSPVRLVLGLLGGLTRRFRPVTGGPPGHRLPRYQGDLGDPGVGDRADPAFLGLEDHVLLSTTPIPAWV